MSYVVTVGSTSTSREMAIGVSLLAADPAEDTRLPLMVAFQNRHATV
jgi:hypothetical protein